MDGLAANGEENAPTVTEAAGDDRLGGEDPNVTVEADESPILLLMLKSKLKRSLHFIPSFSVLDV